MMMLSQRVFLGGRESLITKAPKRTFYSNCFNRRRISASAGNQIPFCSFSKREQRTVRSRRKRSKPCAISQKLTAKGNFFDLLFRNLWFRSGTYFCTDKSVTATVIHGLAEHKETVGAPLCPCRHYDDKVAEVKLGYWNCPCVPMRERKECHCMLFLTKDNPFVGEDQDISMDEILAARGAL